MPATLIWKRRSLGSSCQTGKMAALLKSILFVFKILFLPKYRVGADWPTGQSLFLMSHPDVSLVNILLSITRVSLVQNKCVFGQLPVRYIGDPGITKTYLGIQHVHILQYLHELNGNVHYVNISNVPTLNCVACKLQRFNRDEHSADREQWIRPI